MNNTLMPLTELMPRLQNKLKGATYCIKYGVGVEIAGFGSSEPVILYIDPVVNPSVPCRKSYRLTIENHYKQIRFIQNYDDLVGIAWHNFILNKIGDSFHNPPDEWVEDFMRLNFLKKKTVAVYEILPTRE